MPSEPTEAIAGNRKTALILALVPLLTYYWVNGLTNVYLSTQPKVVFWLIDGLFVALLPTVLYCYLASRLGIRWSTYGFKPMAARDFIAATLFGTLAVATIDVLVLKVLWPILYRAGWAEYAQPLFFYGEVMPNGWLRIPALLYLSSTAAVVETVVFVGAPWLLWQDRIGDRLRTLFVLITAAVFAAAHWELGLLGLVGAFGFGVVASRQFLRYRNLVPLVAMHFVIDMWRLW